MTGQSEAWDGNHPSLAAERAARGEKHALHLTSSPSFCTDTSWPSSSNRDRSAPLFMEMDELFVLLELSECRSQTNLLDSQHPAANLVVLSTSYSASATPCAVPVSASPRASVMIMPDAFPPLAFIETGLAGLLAPCPLDAA
jgi:hypothetical protein